MKRGATEEGRIPMELRVAIAENLKKLMRIAPDGFQTAAGLGDKAKVGRRTIDRLRNPQKYPELAPTLGSLVAIATALERDVWELLLPARKAAIQDKPTTSVLNNSALRNSGRKDKGRRTS